MSDTTAEIDSLVSEAAHVYGVFKQEEMAPFLLEMCCQCESPIEQKFLIFFFLACTANSLECEFGQVDSNARPELRISIQQSIEKYRIDFAIQHDKTIILVELDGHKWHERTDQERRYEKSRDRRLGAIGYRVMHFTGSEVYADPYAVACEVIEAVTGIKDTLQRSA